MKILSETLTEGACETRGAAIATGMFFPARYTISGPPHGLPTSGGTHEQICDPAFDAGDIRDGAGAGSNGHASQRRDQQRQAYQEA
jgi:hypothetical protein